MKFSLVCLSVLSAAVVRASPVAERAVDAGALVGRPIGVNYRYSFPYSIG